MEVKEIIELMRAASAFGLTKMELEQGDLKLVLKKDGTVNTTEHVRTVQEPVVVHDTQNIVTCPLVGTFYSASSPEAENFVKVGDHVKKGQILGIVEAMKLMNEIESEYDGIVEQIFVENESTVEYGQPLFQIR